MSVAASLMSCDDVDTVVLTVPMERKERKLHQQDLHISLSTLYVHSEPLLLLL